MDFCAERIKTIESDIRGKNYYTALDFESKGIKVLKLNTGNPATFGFGMPDSVRAALMENPDRAVGYSDPRGMLSARQAILDYHLSTGIKDISLDDVFIGNGVSEIGSILSTVLFNPGDEILLPMPTYSLWSMQTELSGAKPVYYKCDEQNGWNPDIDHIKSLVTPKTKCMVVINPNNPTGVVYSEEILKEIAEIARQNNIIVLSDEIYDRLVFEGKKHIPFANVAPDVPVITMSGLSKSHCLCGFRCGWMVLSGNEKVRSEIREGIMKVVAIRLSANAIMETIIPAAIKDTEYTKAMLKEGGRLYEQRKAAWAALDKIEGLSYVKNDAAFYIFPRVKAGLDSDKKFVRELLLEKKILLVPGTGFLQQDNDHFRIILLPEANELNWAINEIGDFLKIYNNKRGV